VVVRRAVPPDFLAAVVRRAVPDFLAVVARRAVPPDFRAVVLRAVVLRPAVDARRAVDALRAGLDRPPPWRAFSASLASLRALFNHEALPLRRFAGSFLICFSMESRVVP
jgi:hypothetical protein